MKKILLFLVCLSMGVLYAQVGINTKNPLGIFHVDPKENTNATGTTGFDDDVIVTYDGKMGLGTLTPNSALDVRGKFKLANGTEGKGRYLTSDANGIASWKEGISTKKFISGTTNAGLIITQDTPIYTDNHITIPEGTWMVAFTYTCVDYYKENYMIWRLSTSNTVLTPYLNSAKSTAYSCSSILGYGVSVSCYFLVKNTTPTTYYLWASLEKVTTKMSYTGERSLYAIPLS